MTRCNAIDIDNSQLVASNWIQATTELDASKNKGDAVITAAIHLITTNTSTVTTSTTSVSPTVTAIQTMITPEGKTSTTSMSTTIQSTAATISLATIDRTAHAVYRTSARGDSTEATAKDSIFGQYNLAEGPADAIDDYLESKYLNRGLCRAGDHNLVCGLDTGLYFELQRGATLVTGLRVCTANDNPGRDPIKVTLEGSNQSGSALTRGSSWTLIYKGDIGLIPDPGRHECAAIQWFNNSVRYKSYRFLVTHKRAAANSVQYAEVQLFGY